MFFRLFKNNIRKKFTMHLILLMFITLASIFMASGLNNVVTVVNGTDHFLDRAGVGDYIIFVEDSDTDQLEKILSSDESVSGYRMDENIMTGSRNFRLMNGDEPEMKSTVLIQSVDRSAMHFFDSDNTEISQVAEGHAYVPGRFLEDNDLKTGDQIRITVNGVTLELVLDGAMKDAFCGSQFISMDRILLNDSDYQTLLDYETIAGNNQGRFFYIDTDDVTEIGRAVSKADNISATISRSALKSAYVIDLILAFITLILSLCLIIVSFVVLKFSITFHIMEEYREIGVMKAIGIGNKKIESLYLMTYLMLAVVGSVIGFLCSIPFGKLLVASVSKNMVLEKADGLWFNAAGSVLVVLTTVMFARICASKVKKATPLDAIRNGQTGERFRKKRGSSMETGRGGSVLYLAKNDIINDPRRYITMALAFCICTLLVLVLENSTATLAGDDMIRYLYVKTDLYMIPGGEISVDKNTFPSEDKLGQAEEKLEKAGLPAEVSCDINYKYPVSFDGATYSVSCYQGLNTDMESYEVIEGSLPQSENEIAITKVTAEELGAKIGDTVTIHFSDGDKDCIVSGYFETLMNTGVGIRLYKDAPTDIGHAAGYGYYQIEFSDHTDDEELPADLLAERKEMVKEIFDTDDVYTAAECFNENIDVVNTLDYVKYLLLGITMVVILLVTALMERTFIADERSQIALLKSIGFSDRRIREWHVLRLVIVSMVAAIAAAALSIPVTDLCITPIFGMMGASHIDYVIRPLRIFLLYPAVIMLFTVLVGTFAASGIRRIHSRDTAGIE